MVIVIEAVQNFFQSIGFFWQSVILLAIGFLVGNMRRHSTKEKMRLKEMEHERELGKNQLRLAQLGLEKEKQSMALELKKLEYENAEAEHKRKIELAVAVKKEEREETELLLINGYLITVLNSIKSFKRYLSFLKIEKGLQMQINSLRQCGKVRSKLSIQLILNTHLSFCHLLEWKKRGEIIRQDIRVLML